MENAKNIILKTIKDFAWEDIKVINEIHYHQDLNEFYEEMFVLDVGLIAVSGNCQYSLKLRFTDISNSTLEIGPSYIQIGIFEVIDIKDDGWCEKNFLIRNYDSLYDFKLYCNHIEVLSVEKLERGLDVLIKNKC